MFWIFLGYGKYSKSQSFNIAHGKIKMIDWWWNVKMIGIKISFHFNILFWENSMEY